MYSTSDNLYFENYYDIYNNIFFIIADFKSNFEQRILYYYVLDDGEYNNALFHDIKVCIDKLDEAETFAIKLSKS